ncbi:reverse transcriptase family protein [Williamsia soli]|uniref:reverse transcriptase family protein n=1 Tax=Williamsia soli TaxID=364929 RepID=UPI001F3E5D4C|nr:reverse transcriptase family protein [Williamsia soli]
MNDSYSLGGLGPRMRLTADSVEHLLTRLEVDPRWTVSALVEMLVATVEQPVVTELLGMLLDRFPERPTDLGDVRTFLAPLIGEPRSREFDDPADPVMRFDLPRLPDYSDVARWLNLTVGELEWFADRGHWLRTKDGPLQHYRYWQVPKRDGVRMIEAPKPHLREIQRRVLRTILDHIPPHRAAQGFVPGTSTASFAWPHTDRPVVVRLDLRDCFSSIGTARVKAIFAAVGYERTARVLAELCTTTTPIAHLRDIDHRQAALLRQRHLPQGAPTSPALANLVMRAMDRRIWGYAQRNRLHYSRYGDDLAISGDHMNPEAVLWVVLRIVADEGFTVHPDKTKTMRAHQRQQLAGLVVNDQPRVARRDYDNLRALLHNAIRTGAQAQNRSAHPNFRAHVHGKIAWIGASSPRRRNTLLALAEQVDWDR